MMKNQYLINILNMEAFQGVLDFDDDEKIDYLTDIYSNYCS